MITDELHDNSLTCWRVRRRAVRAGGPRGDGHPHILADELTLFKPREADYAYHINTPSPQKNFRPSYGSMAYAVRACDRPRADFVGAGGGFSSLVVRSFQLFHPLVGKQLSSAICQSANRGQIRGLLSWCCCSVVAVQADQNSMSTKTQCCVTILQGLIFFSYDFTT